MSELKGSPLKMLLIVVIALLSALLVLSVLVVFGDIPGIDVNFGDGNGGDNSIVNEEDGLDDRVISQTDPGDTVEESVSCANCDAYSIDLGDGKFVTAPAGWDVVSIIAPYENLTAAEMSEYIQPDNIGTWPIEGGLEVTLTNGVSEISLNKSPIFAAGGIGGTVAPVTGVYNAIRVPSVTEFGVVRYEDSGEYTYYPIQLNSSYNPNGVNDLDTSMYHHLGLGMGDIIFSFSGDVADLVVADTFVLEACGDNTSGLCY